MTDVNLDRARVLVIVYGHVADTMAAIPGLRSMRRAYPGARIEAMVIEASVPVLRGCPYVDEIVAWEDFNLKGTPWARAEKAAKVAALGLLIRRRAYDAVLVFHRSFGAIRRLAALSGARVVAGLSDGRDGYTHCAERPGPVHSSREENRAVLAAIGVDDDGLAPELWTTPDEETRASELLASARGGPLVGLHPGSDWSCQQWLPERFAAVGRELAGRLGATMVITGSRSETSLQREIVAGLDGPVVQAAGTTTLGELVALVRHLDLLVTVNSAPAAIAQAVGTPSVVLLGPEDPRLTGLMAGERVGVVQGTERLAPGSWCEFGRWGVLSGCDSPMCRGVGGLDQVRVDDVTAVAMRILLSARNARNTPEVAR